MTRAAKAPRTTVKFFISGSLLRINTGSSRPSTRHAGGGERVSLPNTITGKLPGDRWFERPRCIHVGVGSAHNANPSFGDAPAIKCACSFGAAKSRQGCCVIDDCFLIIAELQIDEATAVQCICKVRRNTQ